MNFGSEQSQAARKFIIDESLSFLHVNILMYLSVNSFQYCLYWWYRQQPLDPEMKVSENVYIKTLGLPEFSVFDETITSNLVGYHSPWNIPSTESDESIISGTIILTEITQRPPQRHTLDQTPAHGQAPATLDLPWTCDVGWCSDPYQCPVCVIYASVPLIYLPCLEVFFFTEILHSASGQEACGKCRYKNHIEM